MTNKEKIAELEKELAQRKQLEEETQQLEALKIQLAQIQSDWADFKAYVVKHNPKMANYSAL